LVSTVLSVAAIVWAIAQWVLEGRRVKVTLLHAVMGKGGIATGPAAAVLDKSSQIAAMRRQAFSGPELIGIKVINVGRLPVQITGIQVVCDLGMSYSETIQSNGPKLPHRIEAGEADTWYYDMENVRALVDSMTGIGKPTNTVWMTASLATGKDKKTSRAQVH
jgi:hypothetical protein